MRHMLFFLAACAGTPPDHVEAPADAPPAAPADAPPAAPTEEPIAGGIVATPVDADAIAAFDHVLPLLQKKHDDKSLAVVAIKTHTLQVVAGLNHTWDVDVTTKDGPRTLHVVAWEKLDKTWEVTEESGW